MKTILYIGNKLSKHGLSVTSIETLGVLLSNEGYKMYFSSSVLNKVGRLIDMLWSVIHRRNKIDYLLIDTYSTSNFWYAFLVSQLARFFNIKYIPVLRGGNLLNRLKNNPKLSAKIFKYAYVNVAPSNYLYSAFQNLGYTNLIHIANSIDLKNYPIIDKKYEIPHILWVRAIDSIYNPEMAIKVLAQIKVTYPTATLCMVGPEKNSSISNLQKIAKELGVTVKFTGKLAKKEWVAISKEYNVFINTTHVDNTPVSVMEALALGLPVVSTNVGGLPYLLKNGETAILVNDDDVNGMTSAILNLFENPQQKEKLIQNGLILAKTFDWQVVKYDWIKILK